MRMESFLRAHSLRRASARWLRLRAYANGAARARDWVNTSAQSRAELGLKALLQANKTGVEEFAVFWQEIEKKSVEALYCSR